MTDLTVYEQEWNQFKARVIQTVIKDRHSKDFKKMLCSQEKGSVREKFNFLM